MQFLFSRFIEYHKRISQTFQYLPLLLLLYNLLYLH